MRQEICDEETDKHFYERNALIFIFDRISLRIEIVFISDESITTTRSHKRRPKSNIFFIKY